MIFETSIQALFLVPMAISLGIGTLVSAVVVMTFIPAMMVIDEDLGWKRMSTAVEVESAGNEEGKVSVGGAGSFNVQD